MFYLVGIINLNLCMEQYDIAIIGGGPGGYSAALKAIELSAKVALFEKAKLGGACLHKGCIPTKSLNRSSLAKEPFHEAMQRKADVVTSLEKQLKTLMKNVNVYYGHASFVSQNEISVEGKGMSKASKVIVATGSMPFIPQNFDIGREKVMASDEILSINNKPESILIAGGGYIGCEFANIFAGYGAKVSLVELLPGILATEDEEAVKLVLKSFKRMKIDVFTDVHLDSVTISNDKVASRLSNGANLETEVVLFAIGRKPNTKGLGLEAIGVGLEGNGAIKVNEGMETSVKGIFAVGDAIAKELRLAHVAEREGMVAAENALGGSSKMDYRLVPTVVFTHPEIASVGFKEAQLKADKLGYIVGKFWYKGNAMAQCSREVEGFAKIFVNKASHEILGATIVGNSASEMIHEIALAMNAGAKIETLANSVYFHPSKSEIIKMAAAAALKKL